MVKSLVETCFLSIDMGFRVSVFLFLFLFLFLRFSFSSPLSHFIPSPLPPFQKKKKKKTGTPNTLLPLELNQCHYEKGADGKVVTFLTSPTVVQDVITIGGKEKEEEGGERERGKGGRGGGKWNARVLLEVVAEMGGVHSLIDTGALVTRMTNLEVAKFLLQVW